MNLSGTKIDRALIKNLRTASIFSSLKDEDIASIIAFSYQESFKPKEVVFFENTFPDKFYVILNGNVDVYRGFRTKEEQLVGQHGPGQVFGEMALIDDMPRSATVVASNRVDCLVIDRKDFLNLLHNNSRLSQSIIVSVSKIVRELNDTYVKALMDRNTKLEESYAKLEEAYAELKAVQEEGLRNERLSIIGKLSSVIFHDIRNPLSVINVLSNFLLLHKEDPVEIEKDIFKMRREIKRMERLAAEVLDFSRGDVRLNLSLTTLERVFDQLRSSCQDALVKEGIDFSFDYDEDLSLVLDEERFVRVLINLVENGRKALAPKGRLSVLARKKDEHILFTVSDSGAGMDKNTLARVFEPFFSQADGGGTGLGMFTVKNIVDAHQGNIDISSEPGRGTDIHIAIPLKINLV